jgi:hypothetical protein
LRLLSTSTVLGETFTAYIRSTILFLIPFGLLDLPIILLKPIDLCFKDHHVFEKLRVAFAFIVVELASALDRE